jgi:hypothetical protein
VRVRVSARKQRFAGQPQPLIFTVKATEDGHPSAQASATFLQAALLPERIGRWLIGLALLIGLGALAWFALLKPAVEDTAEDAARAAVVSAVPTTEDAPPTNTNVTVTTAPATGEPVSNDGVPWDHQWAVEATQGEVTQSESETVDVGRVLRLSDVFWSNEAQDSGTVTLLRDGEVVLQFALGSNRNWSQALRNGVEVPAGSNLAVATRV